MLRRLPLSLLLSCAFALTASAQTLVTSIPVSGTPNGIAVNPNNNRIYVALGSSVAVIDGGSNTVIDTISITQGASQVAINLVTGRIYAAGCNFAQNPATCSVAVIDGASDAVLRSIPLAGSNGIGVQGIAVNPVTNQIYISDDMNYELAVIDGSTNHLSYINTGQTEMLGLAVDYVTNQILGAPSGAVLDLINGTSHALSRVKVGQINQDVAVNFFTGFAYVTNNSGNTLGVVNLSTLQNVANIDVGSAPFGVCVDYLSNRIFVGNTGDQTVAVVDGKTNKVVGTVAVFANYLDVNPATRLVYGSDPQSQMVHVISE